MSYADASVIVKRCRAEAGSGRAHEAWPAAERLFTSWISYAEVHAALARKQRARGLPLAECRTAARTFDREWPACDQIAVNVETLAAVRPLVWRPGLRGFDAIHLAAAVWLQSALQSPGEFPVSRKLLRNQRPLKH